MINDYACDKLGGHRAPVVAIDSKDPNTVASASEDCTARLWDLRTLKAYKSFISATPIPSIVFDKQDEHQVHVILHSSELHSFDLRKPDVLDRVGLRKLELDIPPDCEINSMSMHYKDKVIAIADDDKITIVDLVLNCQKSFRRLHSNVISKVMFKPKSKLASSCGFDYLFRTWDYRSGKLKVTKDHKS